MPSLVGSEMCIRDRAYNLVQAVGIFVVQRLVADASVGARVEPVEAHKTVENYASAPEAHAEEPEGEWGVEALEAYRAGLVVQLAEAR